VDLGFFKDVLVPPHGLPDPSFWHAQDEASGADGWATQLVGAGDSRRMLTQLLGGQGSATQVLGAAHMHTIRCESVHRHCSSLFKVSTPPSSSTQAWLWKVEGQDLFFEKGLPVRFKVQSVRFHAPPTLAEQQEQVRRRGMYVHDGDCCLC